MRRGLVVVLVGLTAAVALVACGDDEEEGKEALDKAACVVSAVAPAGAASGVNLPQGFPQVEGVSFSGSTTAGPATITTGSSTKDMDAVYRSFKDDLDKDPYSVTKSEKEKDDAEVNFESDTVTGQVKLRECENDKTAVQVTARPK